MKVHNNKKLITRRKELRYFATPQEEKLWYQLRNNKFGFRFRRQHSIGGCILDFYCFKARLIIELDSISHNKKNDTIRDKFFSDLGYYTLRIRNKEIDNNIDKVLESIKSTLSLRLGEGGEAG